MATRNIVPQADNEGYIGVEAKRWKGGRFRELVDTYQLTDGPMISVTTEHLEMATRNVLLDDIEIAPAATELVDILILSQVNTGKWIINLKSATQSLSYEVLARARGTDVEFNTFGLVGDRSMSHVRAITSDGTYLSFDITNNGPEPVTVTFRRCAI